MIESIKTITKEYASNYDQLKGEFEKQKKHIDENYKGALMAEKIRQMKEIYDAAVWKIKSESKKKAEKIFSDAEIIIKSKVTDEIPVNAINEIELLEKSNPTEEEVKSFLTKYKNSYLVCKRIKSIADNKKMNIEIITIDDLVKELNYLKNEVLNFFDIYVGHMNSYKAELILNGSMIDRIDNSLNSFYEQF